MKVQNNPLVSIIVPVYNLEQYVETFVKSIKAQTYSNFEAVIVNDGSKDNSLAEIYQHTQDDARFVVISKENQGVSIARKTGIEQSKGQYITFLDADDILMPEVIERMVDAIQDNYDIISCNIQRICSTYESPMQYGQIPDMCGTEFLEAIIRHKIYGSNCAKLYKRELFNNVTYYPLRLSEDSLLNMQIGCLMPRVRFIDYVGYGYLQRQGSSNHTPFDYNYMVSFSDAVEKELNKHDDTLKGRATFFALLNKIRWYRLYASKSRNNWIGDSEFAKNVEIQIRKYKLELRRYNLSGMLLFISIYHYRFMHPLILLYTTFKRLSKSFKRRFSK